jgi:pantothenate kinase
VNFKNFNVIGVDVGGTFTDLIYVNKNNGSIEFAKVPTSSDNQAFGVMNAIQKAKLNLDEVKLIVHEQPQLPMHCSKENYLKQALLQLKVLEI